MMQSMTWNVLSPISDNLRLAFGVDTFSDSFITLNLNTANIVFLLVLFPTMWMIGKWGPRVIMLLSAFLLLLSTTLRCIPSEGHDLQILMFASMILNGSSGTWLNFGGPVISQTWFPPEQRTLATAIGSIATYAGAALGYAGPFIAGDCPPSTNSSAGSGSESNQAVATTGVRLLFHVEAAACLLCLIAVLIYFPDQPDEPPSEAAALLRIEKNIAKDDCDSKRGSIIDSGTSNVFEGLLPAGSPVLYEAKKDSSLS